MGAKPRYPIFFSFGRNWFANGLNGRRGEGVGYGLGFGRFVGGLFGFRGANEAHAGDGVGVGSLYGAINYEPINCVEKCRFHNLRCLNLA